MQININNVEVPPLDKIIICDLLARGHIGISDAEREHPQDILINVTLSVDLHRVGKSDHIDDTVSYSTISRNILTLVDGSTRKTVEAMASDIATLCLKNELVHSVKVRVEKPGVVRFVHSVGVEIERNR
jgi:FolB domain-containing protein